MQDTALTDFKRRVSYIMKTLCNEPQKRVNDLYQLLQFAMRPKRSYTTVGIGGFDSLCLHLSTSTDLTNCRTI